jgi:hypothetical protein
MYQRSTRRNRSFRALNRERLQFRVNRSLSLSLRKRKNVRVGLEARPNLVSDHNTHMACAAEPRVSHEMAKDTQLLSPRPCRTKCLKSNEDAGPENRASG